MLISNTEEFFELSVETVYTEWKKWAEKGVRHDLIFKFMRDTGLIEYYPDLKMLKHTPQDKIYHPEGDVEIHTELCLTHLDKLIKETDPMVAITGPEKIIVVMATLLHDIAKPQTTEEQMKNDRMTITSHGHEAMGGVVAKKFLSGIGFSDELSYPICNLIANHLAGVNISVITSLAGQVKAVKKLSRRLHPATITQLLCVMEADTNGRGGTEYKSPTGGNEIADIAMSLKVTEKQYEYVLMGRHLIEAGLKPSPEFKVILEKSHEAQENGEFSDVEGAKKWLTEFIEKRVPQNSL
jgi:tRNA nucleotidyltransferase (CCA-adding enzyme)